MKNDENAAKKKSHVQRGSFWISEYVMNFLIAHATAEQICTYLILAKYTDEFGVFSTAGMTAVKKAMGIGDRNALRLLADLVSLTSGNVTKDNDQFPEKIVFTAEEWGSQRGQVPERQMIQSQIRFCLDQFEGSDSVHQGRKIWFSNGLVDGYGQFAHPLKRLSRLGVVAARMLLVMYRENDMEQFGGVAPQYIYSKYSTNNMNVTAGGYCLWHATPESDSTTDPVALTILHLKEFSDVEDEKNEQYAPLWLAIKALTVAGFIYEMISVLDSEPGKNSSVIYELKSRNGFGRSPNGEEGIAGETARLAGLVGCPVTKKGGKFEGKYAAFIEPGVKPVVAGIFRIRFRVTNPKNYTVVSTWRRINGENNQWRETIKGITQSL